MPGQRIGYVRVSSFDQNPERQLDQAEVDRVFTDKASGKNVLRPQLDQILAYARESDTEQIKYLKIPRERYFQGAFFVSKRKAG